MENEVNVAIKPANKLGVVPKFLFGQFIEYMFDCIDPGLYAQVLKSRGFAYPDSEISGVSFPWNIVESESEFTVFLDKKEVYAPYQSQVIELLNGEAAGIEQRELQLFDEVVYHGYLYLKSDTLVDMKITIISEESKEILFSTVFRNIQDKWTKFEYQFNNEKQQFVTVRYELITQGKIWIDQTSLRPNNHIHNCWPTVYKKIEEIKPTVLRYPGGCFADTYNWLDGVGPVDKRPGKENIHWGGWEENNFGTDEFMELCESLNVEPIFCVNYGSGTAEEAANWVEYCNGSLETEFGKMRAQNGHPEPYNVKYWEVGNELYADWELGHTTSDAYATSFMDFYKKMKAVDPEIEFLACAGDGNSRSQGWNKELCEKLGDKISFLSTHIYAPLVEKKDSYSKEEQYYAVAGAAQHFEELLQLTFDTIRESGSSARVAVTEWNGNYQDGSNLEETIETAVFNASLLNTFIRNSENIAICNASDLVNGWPGGLIKSTKGECYGTVSYEVIKMYANTKLMNRVEVSVESDSYSTTPVGNIEAMENVPYVDVLACETEDGDIAIFVINRHLSKEMNIAIRGIDFGTVEMTTIWSEDIYDRNNFRCEEVLSEVIGTVHNHFKVKPHSINKLVVKVN